MASESKILRLLQKKPAAEIEEALRRNGFVLRRQTRTGGRIYAHPDGRITVLHYHRRGDRLPLGTLSSFLAATRWTEDDARRLGLIS